MVGTNTDLHSDLLISNISLVETTPVIIETWAGRAMACAHHDLVVLDTLSNGYSIREYNDRVP